MRFYGRPVYPIALFATVTITVIALSTTFLLWDLRKRVLAHDQMESIGITRMFIEQTERNFEGLDLVLTGVQNRLQTSFATQFALNSPEVHLLLGSRALSISNLDALYLIDAKGQVVNSSVSHPVASVSVADQSYFKAAMASQKDGLYIDRPIFDPSNKKWVLYLSRKIYDGQGLVVGLVVAAVNTDHFEEIYKFFKLDYDRPVSLYRADGILIASIPHKPGMIGEVAPELNAQSLKIAEKEIKFFSHALGDGSREEHTLSRVAKFPLLVSVNNSHEEALASWRETAIPIVFGSGFMSLFIIVLAGLMIKKVIREEKLASALGDATDRYHHTINSVMDAIVAMDKKQNIILFNPAAEKMFGYSADEIMGKPLTNLMPHRFRDGHSKYVNHFKKASNPSGIMRPQLGILGLRADGTEFPIETTVSSANISGEIQLTAVLRDVTEHQKAEQNLREMNIQLRGLSASLQDVREQERTRIARELHDELGQQLTGLKLDLSWLSSRIKEGRDVAFDKIDEMRRLLDIAISSVRRISTELRPVMLDDLGFAEAITWQLEEFSKRSGIAFNLDLPGKDCVKDSGLATALFRIVQESLTNITRYAMAKQVDVKLACDDDYLILTIQDDGVGVDEKQKGQGFGLVSMRERANALGGEFELISKPGSGTQIRVSFPLDASIFSGIKV